MSRSDEARPDVVEQGEGLDGHRGMDGPMGPAQTTEAIGDPHASSENAAATGGAASGAVVGGAVAGPIGLAVGAVLGAVAGAVAGPPERGVPSTPGAAGGDPGMAVKGDDRSVDASDVPPRDRGRAARALVDGPTVIDTVPRR